MLVLKNTCENIILGSYSEGEFTYKIREIAIENGDEELSITTLGEAQDYVDNYCGNLDYHFFMELDFNFLNSLYKCKQENDGVSIYNSEGERIGLMLDEKIPTAKDSDGVIDIVDATDELFNRIEDWLLDNE